MIMTKKRKSELMLIANESIMEILGNEIKDSYNGQIAAFSVSVALSGLKPTMAIYFNESSNAEVDKRKIIDLLASMYSKDNHPKIKSNDFYQNVIKCVGKDEDKMRKLIIEYAIALKLTVRTFKLLKS